MERYTAELFYKTRCQIGEGPVYDDCTDTLYWIDITGKTISSYVLSTKEYSCLNLERTVGSIALIEGGGILAALDDGMYVIKDLAVTPYCKPEDLVSDQRLNDGKCDRQGRMYVGIMHVPLDGPKGSFYRIEKGGKCTKLLDNIGCSNGLAWNSDYTKFYYVDTLIYEPTYVKEFKYDEETGDISDPKVIIEYPGLLTEEVPSGSADGMTIDAEGKLWIAEWNGHKVSRWDPETGEKLAEVAVPVSKPACCTFGGKDMDTLFITTASCDCDLQKEPDAGSVYCVKPGVKGLKANRFKL